MPWRATPRVRASLSYAFLVLAMSVVVSCVTVAGDAAPEADEAAAASGAAGAPTATPPTLPSPSPSPAASPASSPTPTPAPTLRPSPVPSATPRVVVLSEPVAVGAPATLEPQPTLLPLATPEAVTAGADAAGASRDGDGADTDERAPQPGEPRLDSETTEKLERILKRTVNKDGVIGLQAAVRLPSGEIWLGSAGQAELDPARPIEDDTQFAIASITKTFVAALILRLAEEGKVDLDAPFGTYFEDAPRSKTVTLRQLLSHTSGIYNFWQHPRYLNVISRAWWESPDATGLLARDHRWTYEEMMDLVKSGYHKPGKGYSYSNTNYVILGKVAEAVEGVPLPRQLRQRFFEPLGMEDTVYQPTQLPRADAAHGHWNTGSGYMDHTRDARVVPFMAAVTIADAAGAMASTARDLATWADALYGGTLLSDASLRQMTTMLRPGLYGLGTDVAVFHGHRAYGHRGGIRGYESSMWYFPDSGVSIVLLSNQGNWVSDVPMKKLVKAVLGAA